MRRVPRTVFYTTLAVALIALVWAIGASPLFQAAVVLSHGASLILDKGALNF